MLSGRDREDTIKLAEAAFQGGEKWSTAVEDQGNAPKRRKASRADPIYLRCNVELDDTGGLCDWKWVV